MSKTIQDDLIERTAHVTGIQEEIYKEINTVPFIAVEVDHTTDITCKCSYALCIHCYESSFLPLDCFHNFLNFFSYSKKRTASTIRPGRILS